MRPNAYCLSRDCKSPERAAGRERAVFADAERLDLPVGHQVRSTTLPSALDRGHSCGGGLSPPQEESVLLRPPDRRSTGQGRGRRRQTRQDQRFQIDPDLGYTDDCDAHLHAAAEHGDVQYVITNDRGFHEFARTYDEDLGYEVYTPDDFLMLVHRDAISTVRETLLGQIAYHRSLGRPFNLAARLDAAQAPNFAGAIRDMMQTPAVADALSSTSPAI